MSEPFRQALHAEIRRLFRARRAGRGAVGVELELLPRDAAAAASLPAAVAGLDPPGRFTFEPGGQVEYSSTPCPDVAGLVRETGAALASLETAARRAGIELVARGLAPWHGPSGIGLQRPTRRYVEMDRYFAARGPWGAWMMRLTASLQVNLDLGPPDVAARRWRAANALVPTLVATFANSPARLPDGSRVASGRSWIWRQLDPGRTGILGRSADGAAPWREYVSFALAAPVMFDAEMRPLSADPLAAPRFSDWWSGRGGSAGRPGLEDWRVHLSTLFPEVRPRGRLEIRSVDVPELRWWPVAPAVLAAVLYDVPALAELEQLLSARGAGVDELADRAVRRGLGDPALGTEAAGLFGIADRAIARFPSGWFGDVALRAVAGFRERYVESGRTQADDAVPGLVAPPAPVRAP